MNQLLSNKETDELGERLIGLYCKEKSINSLCVDIEGFATDYLKLNIEYETFAGDDTDTIGFLGDGNTPVCVSRNGENQNVVFPWKTIVIDKFLLGLTESGRKRFTIAHEVAHYLLERMHPELAIARHHRVFDSERHYSPAEMKRMLDFTENRADRLAAALMMPKFNILKALERFAGNKKFTVYGDSILSDGERTRMQIMADGIGVTRTALQIRLKDLGLIEYRPFEEFIRQDFQEGDFDDSDIEYDRRYGKLSPEQTYLIHRSRREAQSREQRTVKCPACRFRMATISTDSNGSQQLRCKKCGFNEILNLAYFRKNRTAPRTDVQAAYKRKNKR